MDKLDLQIARELAKDAQISFSRIAKIIGLTPKTVLERYKRMKKDGVLGDSMVSIDLLKLGYEGRVFMSITNVANRERKETISALKRMKNIFLITEIMGDFDIIAIGGVKDFKGLISLVNAVRALPSVDQVEFTLTDDAPFPVSQGFERILGEKIGNDSAH